MNLLRSIRFTNGDQIEMQESGITFSICMMDHTGSSNQGGRTDDTTHLRRGRLASYNLDVIRIKFSENITSPSLDDVAARLRTSEVVSGFY
jgi:hypothetical protein